MFNNIEILLNDFIIPGDILMALWVVILCLNSRKEAKLVLKVPINGVVFKHAKISISHLSRMVYMERLVLKFA